MASLKAPKETTSAEGHWRRKSWWWGEKHPAKWGLTVSHLEYRISMQKNLHPQSFSSQLTMAMYSRLYHMGPEIIRRKLIILQPKADWETPGNCTLSLPWLLKRPRTYPPRKMNMSPKSISKGRDRLPSIIFEGLLLLVSGVVSLGFF